MTITTDSKTDRIRDLNDDFRRTFVGGAVMITAGVEAMPLINAVRCCKKSAASKPSAKTTTRMANTTSARWTRPASAAFSSSIITTGKPSLARPIPLTPLSRRAS